MNEFANAFAPPGLRVAADIDADQPLAGLPRRMISLILRTILSAKTNLRRTCGTRGRCLGLVFVGGSGTRD
jgi:hypothetical protein